MSIQSGKKLPFNDQPINFVGKVIQQFASFVRQERDYAPYPQNTHPSTHITAVHKLPRRIMKKEVDVLTQRIKFPQNPKTVLSVYWCTSFLLI